MPRGFFFGLNFCSQQECPGSERMRREPKPLMGYEDSAVRIGNCGTQQHQITGHCFGGVFLFGALPKPNRMTLIAVMGRSAFFYDE